MQFGAALSGPTGTGKTESIKVYIHLFLLLFRIWQRLWEFSAWYSTVQNKLNIEWWADCLSGYRIRGHGYVSMTLIE